MKQFCGLGKEEPLSSWSNSKHPLTIIHCVVSDFWKSEVLKNNWIWKISSSFSFLPFLWQLIPQRGKNTQINAEGISSLKRKISRAVSCYHSFLLLFDPNHTCGDASVILATAMTLTSETRGSPVAGHPSFPGVWRARESISWTSHWTALAFPIINFTQATNLCSVNHTCGLGKVDGPCLSHSYRVCLSPSISSSI